MLGVGCYMYLGLGLQGGFWVGNFVVLLIEG